MKVFKLSVIFFIMFLVFSCSDKKDSQKEIKSNNKYEKLYNDKDYKDLIDDMKKLKYPEAELLVKKLLKRYPDNAEIYYLYAVMVKNTSPDPLDAIKILEAAVKFDDKHGKALKLLGDLYFIRKDYKKALKSWEMAIETIKDNATLYYRLGNLYYSLKDYKNALKYFEKSLKLDDKNEWTYYNIGEIYFRILQKRDKGIEYIKKGLKLLPKSKNLNQKLALFYYDSGEYKKAIEWDKKVLEIMNYDNFAIENISDAYMQLKDYENAAKWLDKILKEQPKSVYYLNKMAEIYLIKKDFEKAVDLYEFSYKLRKDSDIKSKIAKLYLAMGNKEKYKEILKELKVSDNPEDIRASRYLEMELKDDKSEKTDKGNGEKSKKDKK